MRAVVQSAQDRCRFAARQGLTSGKDDAEGSGNRASTSGHSFWTIVFIAIVVVWLFGDSMSNLKSEVSTLRSNQADFQHELGALREKVRTLEVRLAVKESSQ